MSEEIQLFSVGIGINNKIVPHRLPFGKDGVSAFEAATDVLIDKTGEVVTRRGTSLATEGSFHSVYPTDDGFYVVKERDVDTALYKAVVASDGSLTLTGIRSDLSIGAHMDFTPLGEKTLYCNGYQNGILDGDVSSAWPINNWTGPDESASMTSIPIGQHIDILSGRALVSVDTELFYSEYGLVGLIDAIGNRVRFEAKIIMIYAVQSGYYLSDTKAVYFVGGTNPKEWICKKVLNYPAIEWGRHPGLVKASDLGIESSELSALFATVNGPVIGLPNGTVFNLIDKNIKMPDLNGMQSGSIMIVDESLIIQSGV